VTANTSSTGASLNVVAAGPRSVNSTIPSPVVLADHPNTFFSISLRVATSHSVFSIQSGSNTKSSGCVKKIANFSDVQIIQKELEPGDFVPIFVVRKHLQRRVINGHYQQGRLTLRSLSTVKVAGKCQRGIFTLEFLRSGTITPTKFLTFSNTQDFWGP